MTQSCLVTGGAGFIGSHIADALVRRGDRVRVIDDLCTGNLGNLESIRDQIEFVEADILDESALASAMQGVDLVFHQAALASVPLSLEQPEKVHEACATGTLNVLRYAHGAGVKRVVYAASSSCYGDQPFASNREADSLHCLSPYAAAKLAGELYCQAFYESFGLETVVLRYFNVFGPRQDPDSAYSAVIPLFITWLLSGKPPVVYGDGHQSRDFTYISNVVNGNLLAGSVPAAAGQTLNLANGRSTTLLELLDALKHLLDVDISPDFQPARQGDVRDSLADISRAVAVLNYSPAVGMEEGLRCSIDYYRSIIQPTSS
ncbi:MAG: SDR family oxidoreductase [Pirellulaceae bacterium]